ncbi:MAG TPA: hypothetical protein VIX83_02110 [Candidatus Cybelea sp.]
MRSLPSAIGAIATAALLAACSGGLSSTTPAGDTGVSSAITRDAQGHLRPHWSRRATLIPDSMRPNHKMPLHGVPLIKKGGGGGGAGVGGFYVGELLGSELLEYAHKNTGNAPPACTIGGVSLPQGISSDDQGDIIEPDGGTATVQVFKGRGECGPSLGTINDTYGEPVDASTPNAVSGKIAVANVFDFFGAGSVSVCTLSGGCSANLSNPNMFAVSSVVMKKGSGDCWASAVDSSGNPTLTWFAGCTGSGQTATGYQNGSFGGLDIDNKGNIVSLDSVFGTATVYSGCNPTCTVVSGPYALQGNAVFGHLNKQSMTFAAADVINGQIDVYKYHQGTFNYWYSFNNGLSAFNGVEGVTYSPRSRQ